MSPESEQLKAARASGSLTNVIGALRKEARRETANASTPVREQVGLEDATIRVAAGLAGTKGAERRQALNDVQVGKTVTAKGVEKTRLSRQERLAKTLAWATSLTEEQREQFILSEKFEGLSDSQQEAISEAFAEITDREYSKSIGIQDIDELEAAVAAETVDVDQLTANDDDVEDDVVDDSDSDFEAMFEQAAWEAEAT